jgi:hypothetical protein
VAGNKKIGPEDLNVTIKFGGGLHTRASPDEIDVREAADGNNFLIDIQDRNLKPRAPFDLIGTVPNAASVLGGGSLLKTDGTVSTLFQAGNTVYQWDGHTTFTSKGTVAATAKLRGHWRTHVWNLTDELLFTDLALADTVKKWNGTTFSNVTFTNERSSGFGNFFAKYLNVSNERATFSNVKDVGATLPHLMIGSERSLYTVITVNQRPSSSLNDADPFFLISPDLKPINGHCEAFGTAMISTERGDIYNLAGTSAKDFSFNPFFPGSAATGSESMDVIGNDIIYGRQGRLESIRDTQNFGNSTSSDISAIIADQIATYTGWTTVYNSRLRLVYLFPTGVSEVWVLDPSIRDANQIAGTTSPQQISPWMRWKTNHAMGFQPTMAMSMLDPVDGLEYVFMGDASGKIYRLEGTGLNGDGGTNNIETQFLTKLFSARLDSEAYNFEGYIKYARDAAFTATLTFQYQGENIFNETITVDLPAASGAVYYGDSAYYGGAFYYGQMSGRMSRKKFAPPGQNSEFQVLIDVVGNADFSINEIGLRFRAAS